MTSQRRATRSLSNDPDTGLGCVQRVQQSAAARLANWAAVPADPSHVAKRRGVQREPGVAGAGGVEDFYRVGGGEDGLGAVVEEAAFGVEFDGDDSRRHVFAEVGDHFFGVGFAGEDLGFGAAGGEEIEMLKDRREEFAGGGWVHRVEGDFCFGREGFEFGEDLREIWGEGGGGGRSNRSGARQHGRKSGEALAEDALVEEGRDAGGVEEAAFMPPGSDGDDGGAAGLEARLSSEDAVGVEAFGIAQCRPAWLCRGCHCQRFRCSGDFGVARGGPWPRRCCRHSRRWRWRGS